MEEKQGAERPPRDRSDHWPFKQCDVFLNTILPAAAPRVSEAPCTGHAVNQTSPPARRVPGQSPSRLLQGPVRVQRRPRAAGPSSGSAPPPAAASPLPAAQAALRAPGGELLRCGPTGPVSASSPENEGTVSTRLPSARDHDIHGLQRETSELLAFLNAQVCHPDTVLNESQKQLQAHWNATAHQKPTGNRPRRERRGTFLWATPAPHRGGNRDATWLRPREPPRAPAPRSPESMPHALPPRQ